ncbi:MAG: VWA domain-containing protein [Venatoribacter sp.]
MFAEFLFLRPQWLWLLAFMPLLLWLLQRSKQQGGAWLKVIDAPRRRAMLSGSNTQKQRPVWPLWLAAWLLATLALAGPTWQKIPQPISKNQQALIVMLDMSLSMAAQDVKPSRAVRANQKITDILRSRKDGLTALLVYAGDAHTVTPLTDDVKTIETLLPALSPFIMPAMGSRPDKAVALARHLANQAGVRQADLLLITDGVTNQDSSRIKAELRDGLRLSILSLGTENGAPIPLPNGGFLRDDSGQIVVPKLDQAPLAKLSRELSSPWQNMSYDDSDWQSMLNTHAQQAEQSQANNQFDLWRDEGFWLIFALLPFALLLFRKGALVAVVLALYLPWSNHSYANGSMWQTPNQQAAKLLEHNPEQAAATFTDPAWQGSAYYQAQQYPQAAQHFQQAPKTAHNLYNLGNAQAQSGQLEQAIKSYEQALALQSDFPQAAKNKQIVEDALKQQQQQQDQNQQNQDQKNQDQKNQEQQNEQSQQGQDQDQKNQDQKSQGQPQNNEQNNEQNGSGQDQPQQNDSEQDKAEQDSSEPADSEQHSPEQNKAEPEENQPTAADAKDSNGLSREDQEAMEQWLKRGPDNPGNLLQRKFLYQYQQNKDQPEPQGEVLW